MHRRFLLDLGVLGASLARRIALGAEAPAIALGDQFAALIEELASVDLLDRAAGEARLMLDQVLEPGLGVELIAELHRAMPRHVDSCEHRMHSRKPADVAAERAVEREDEGGRGKRMHLGAGGIAGI